MSSRKTPGDDETSTTFTSTTISRSRLAGEDPKAVSNKLDFQSFKKHYDSYTVAQALFNKMIKIL